MMLGALINTMSNNVMAQCNTNTFINSCVSELPDGYNLVRSYKIDALALQNSEIKYTHVFSEGSEYIINVCLGEETTNSVEVTLFNSNQEEVATKSIEGQTNPTVYFHCNSTGIYYVIYGFANEDALCGSSVIAYRRSRNKLLGMSIPD